MRLIQYLIDFTAHILLPGFVLVLLIAIGFANPIALLLVLGLTALVLLCQRLGDVYSEKRRAKRRLKIQNLPRLVVSEDQGGAYGAFKLVMSVLAFVAIVVVAAAALFAAKTLLLAAAVVCGVCWVAITLYKWLR